MTVKEVAARHRRRQEAVSVAAVSRSRRLWSEVDVGDLDGSWTAGRLSERLFVAVSTMQMIAAQDGARYVSDVVGVRPEGKVAPRALAGVASDGRDLESLLHEPVVTVKQAVGAGHPLDRATAMGEAALMRIVATQVADAGRIATGLGITARPRTGWVRQINPGACSRCVVLAGKFFRWNQGFLRHPFCHCVHIPASENVAGDLTTDPRRYFDSLTRPEQNRAFTNAGAQAIRDGADIGQVVNARRGMSAAGTTTAGARRGTVRLMPEAVYRQAATRDEALRLLREHRFLT